MLLLHHPCNHAKHAQFFSLVDLNGWIFSIARHQVHVAVFLDNALERELAFVHYHRQCLFGWQERPVHNKQIAFLYAFVYH